MINEHGLMRVLNVASSNLKMVYDNRNRNDYKEKVAETIAIIETISNLIDDTKNNSLSGNVLKTNTLSKTRS